MDVHVLDSTGGIAPGDGKRLRIDAGPIGIPWRLVHRATDDEFGFADEQVDGPFSAWRHVHRFLPNGTQSSVLKDEITFAVPAGALGAFIAGDAINRRLTDVFEFRHRRTQHDLARFAAADGGRPLNIAVTGASGLVGSQLVPFLRAGGHNVTALVRRRDVGADEVYWNPSTGEIDSAGLAGMDAIVHLAGESLADGRWTAKRKKAILESRVQGTALLAQAIARLPVPPRVLVSASAVGFYGDAGDREIREGAPRGDGFLADVCQAWEDAAQPARDAGIRVVHPRFGVVLAGSGGMLKKVGLPFRFGLGGPLGSGDQFMSWITLDDLLGVILTAIVDDRLTGPINAVSPHPVTNNAFTSTLGRVLGRPTFFLVPAPVLRIAVGELADELLLASQNAYPDRLSEVGFHFAFPAIEQALRQELGRPMKAAPAPASEPLTSSVIESGH
jgi:uncharacterized protein (TIGR01777 family)